MSAQPRQQYIFTRTGVRDGLASDEAMAVRQDKKGFIWVATLNGLQRYDGQRFLTLRHRENDPASLPNNSITAIQFDNKDRLWVLCGENRIGYVHTGDLSFHEVPVRLDTAALERSPFLLYADRHGNIFLTVYMRGIMAFDEKKNEFSLKQAPFQAPTGWKPSWIFQDPSNQYWISCDSGLVKYNPARNTYSYRGHNTDNDDVINAYAHIPHVLNTYLDQADRFWVVCWYPSGPGPFLYSYDRATKKLKDWEPSLNPLLKYMYHEVHAITEIGDGTVWFTGLNLFARLDNGATAFKVIPSDLPGEFSIRYDIAKEIFQDREKNMWVSTNRGIFRFNPSAQLFQVIDNRKPGKDSIYTPDVSDIIQTKNGDILVNTWGNGLFAYDSNFQAVRRPFIEEGNKLGESLNWCIYQRQNGDIWRGSQDGYIFITPGGTNKTIRIRPPAFENSTIRQIAEDKHGNLWLGSHRGHIVKWIAATDEFRLIKKLRTIYGLYTDKKGHLWASTGGDGVLYFNTDTDSVINHYTSRGPAGKRLKTIGASNVVQYNDSIYIIASGGLNLLNSKTGAITYVGSEYGLPSNSVNNLILDKHNYLWLTTDSRIRRINMENHLTSTFDEVDGIPTSTFNVSSINMLRDGRIAVGRIHDMIIFSPDKIKPNDMAPSPVEITGFTLMNMRLPMDSLQRLPEINLRYNENSLIIEFSTLTYLNNFAILYKMEGQDKEWIEANNTQAVYNYLPPGNYTFKVKSRNSDGQLSAETTIKIAVRAPFWKTWWFYSILALMVAALFYWDDKVRIRRKEALQQMRSEIAGNLHEEVNKALHNINMLSEIARIKADKDPEQSKIYISEIHHKSHTMIIAMDDMLWSIDPSNDNMAKTIDRIKEFADALRARHDTLIHLHTDSKVVYLKPDMKIRHEVMIIYKLGLRLLVEEMKAPHTSIQMDYIKSQLQLNIFAPGMKLPEQNNLSIKMIEEMKARAASINAVLEIQSDEKGTAILLAVRV